MALPILLAGCRAQPTQVNVLSLRDPSAPGLYFTRFSERYFRHDPRGDLDLVLRSEHEGAGGLADVVTQIVHVHVYWTPIPGTTKAEASMTNAQIHYVIQTGLEEIRYEGGGFVSFRLHRNKDSLSGRIESAQLVPRRYRGNAPDVFGPAQVTGRFAATRDDRQVVRLLNELDRRAATLRAVPRPRSSQ